MARKAHKPTEELRQRVESYAAIGIPQDDIARLIGIAKMTLRKYYKDELKLSEMRANAAVAGALYRAAINGDRTAQIFWLKTRAKWRETDPPKPPSDMADQLKKLAEMLPD